MLLLFPACATTHIIPDTGDVHAPSADLLRVALRGEGIDAIRYLP